MLLATVLALFAVTIARLVYVQTIGASEYVAYGVEQRIEPIELAGGRGAIYDRNGQDLAISIPQTTIAADPSIIEDPQDAARRLSPILGIDELTMLQHLTENVRFVYLARQVPDEVAEAVEALDIPGIIQFGEQARFTPAGDLARSLLGQVGYDNEGLSGVEQAFDDRLSGEPGHLVVERDPEGRTIPAGRHQIDPARPGDDLILTIDRGLQYEVERILANQISAVGAKGGIVIVSDPETGEILAMANQESDPTTGAVANSGNDLAVTANYEPGSVNKMITLSAALEEGLVTPEQVFDVPAVHQVADKQYTDSHPGSLTVTDILAESSNVGTIMIAQQLGEERLDEYLRRFGFGGDTGLGLPHEENGFVPPVADWSGTSIGSIPLGQGVSVTAMQMLFAYNVVANDGIYVAPSLVKATRDTEGERHDTPPGDSRARRLADDRRADACHADRSDRPRHRNRRRHRRLRRRRQDRHGAQAPRGWRLQGRGRQLPLRLDVRRFPAGRRPEAVGHRGHRRAVHLAVRRHGRGTRVRRDRPVRRPHDGRRPRPGAAAPATGHRHR